MSADTPVHVTAPRRVLYLVGALCVVVAVTAPGWAGPTARAALVAVGAVVAAGGAMALVRSVPFASTSRFQPAERERERREVPPELEKLVGAVRDSHASDGRQVLSPTVLLHLRRVAAARLASQRLDVDDPADHAAIQQQISLSLWAVLAPGPGTGRAKHLPSLEVPTSSLPALLDELERL